MSRKPDEWMPLHVRKYLGDTTHLTRDQHGAYFLLLMAYWMRGGPLPDDDGKLAAICKATKAEWRRLRDVLAEFFTVAGGFWSQKRADEELAMARAIVGAKSEAGKAGAAARWHNDAAANGKIIASASSSQRQTDAPLPLPLPVEEERILPAEAGQSVSSKARKAAYPEDFEKFWKAYPTDKNMPKKPALKQWLKLSPEQRERAIAAIPGFRAYCRANDWYRPIYAERFLSDEKFEGYAKPGLLVVAGGSAFDSPEEQEAQNRVREVAYAQAKK